MDYRLHQLGEIAMIFAAAVAVTAILVFGSLWVRRTYHASTHAKVSRQRRRDATRIDLMEGSDSESSRKSSSSRRSRRSRHRAPSPKIDLFRDRAGPPPAAAKEPE